MAIAAGSTASGGSPSRRPLVVLDLGGHRIELALTDLERVRDAAAAQAGSSSRARESVLLERARLTPQTVALREGERKTLARIAGEVGVDELKNRLARTPAA